MISKMRAMGVSGAILVAVMIILGATSNIEANAQDSAVNEVYKDSDGVVHYPWDRKSLPNAHMINEVGVKTQNGDCVFEGSGSTESATGKPSLTIGQEVAFAPETCERQVAVATYALDDMPSVVQSHLERDAELTMESSTASSDLAATRSSWYARINARVQDPIGISVSSTTTERTWDSRGFWSNDHKWGWYSPTGWVRTSQSQVDNYSVADTRATFQNWAFCNPWAATDTNHSRTRLVTNTSGGVNWSYKMHKSGDCSSLLSYHYSLVMP